MAGAAPVALLTGLGGVDLEERAEFGGQGLGRAQRVRAAGVGRMTEHRRGDQRRTRPPVHQEIAGRGDVVLRVGHARCRKIDDPLPQDRPHPGVRNGRGHLVFEEIAVTAGGRARQEHFGTRQAGAPAHRRGADMPALRREDMVVQPFFQGQVVSQAAEKRHRQMGVGVDQPRQDDAAAGVDARRGLRARGACGSRAQRGDPAVADPDKPRGKDVKVGVDGQHDAVVNQGVVSHETPFGGFSRTRRRCAI